MAVVVITLCDGDGCGQLAGCGDRPFLRRLSGFRTDSEFLLASRPAVGNLIPRSERWNRQRVGTC